MTEPAIQLVNLSKRFGDVRAVDDVSIDVRPGEAFFLLGPSGCGKTTLLRILAGLEEPDAGDVRFFGATVMGLPPHRRGAPMVFQNYALWPHLSVADNVAFGLVERRVPKPERATRVAAALAQVGLAGYDDRRPGQLSGGQQQRVALARALVLGPGILLLDEPLSNLDAKLRTEMRGEIARLHKELGIALVYVTHDQTEALALADRMAVMDHGRVRAVGRPDDLYHRPPDEFVATFLGEANLLSATVREIHASVLVVDTDLGPWSATPVADASDTEEAKRISVGDHVTAVVRPEAVMATSPDAPVRGNRFTATVERVLSNGPTLSLELKVPHARGESWSRLKATALNRADHGFAEGSVAHFSVTATAATAFKNPLWTRRPAPGDATAP